MLQSVPTDDSFSSISSDLISSQLWLFQENEKMILLLKNSRNNPLLLTGVNKYTVQVAYFLPTGSTVF